MIHGKRLNNVPSLCSDVRSSKNEFGLASVGWRALLVSSCTVISSSPVVIVLPELDLSSGLQALVKAQMRAAPPPSASVAQGGIFLLGVGYDMRILNMCAKYFV